VLKMETTDMSWFYFILLFISIILIVIS
jgi:hypothetical protein